MENGENCRCTRIGNNLAIFTKYTRFTRWYIFGARLHNLFNTWNHLCCYLGMDFYMNAFEWFISNLFSYFFNQIKRMKCPAVVLVHTDASSLCEFQHLFPFEWWNVSFERCSNEAVVKKNLPLLFSQWLVQWKWR